MDATNVLVEEVLDVWEKAFDATYLKTEGLGNRRKLKEAFISRKGNVESLKNSCQKFLDRLKEVEND